MDDMDRLRRLGPVGQNRFVHRECENSFLARLEADGSAIVSETRAAWPAGILYHLKPKDVTGCDQGGGAFGEAGRRIIRYWVTSTPELKVWRQLLDSEDPIELRIARRIEMLGRLHGNLPEEELLVRAGPLDLSVLRTLFDLPTSEVLA